MAAAGAMLALPVASAADLDNDGIPDDWELTHAGVFAVWPPALNKSLLPYDTIPGSFLLNNDTSSAVTYTATLSNNTVPVYSAWDSITGGVTYAWDEISSTGTLLTTVSNADDSSETLNISGFTFPFFGTSYSQVHVSSNGLLSFDYANGSAGNALIPGPSAPQNSIAVFWDDLDTRTIGSIYYKQEATRLIIQYQNVGRYGGGGDYTFQVVLHSSGKIDLRYKTMTGVLNSASIGVEGEDETQGAAVVHDAAYVANSLAVQIDPISEFFSIPTLVGSVPAYSVGSLNGLFDSLSLPPGVYTADVSLSHTGAGSSPLALTANLTVLDQPGSASITAPTTGSSAMQGNSIWIETIASDPDGIEKVEFYDGVTKLGETTAWPGNDYYSFNWYITGNGSRSITAKAVDLYGGETVSTAVLVNVAANVDFDGMPDSWEIANYLDPNDPYDGDIDADMDGYTNLEEYQLGKDPQIPEDTDFDGMPDGWEYHNGTDIDVDDSSLDVDNDGLTNLEEYQYGTNPLTFDTDGDLLPDLYELENWLNPVVASGEDDLEPDGLTNLEEFLNQTDPNNADSDGDGATDGVEVNQGSDPNNPADGGNPPSDPTEEVQFKVGGDYASWRMEIKSLGPRDTRTLLVVSPAPGTWETKSHKLWKNNKYEITMHHTGSRPQDDPPWYCWEGEVDGQPAVPTFNTLPGYQIGSRNSDAKYFVVKNHWVADNRDGLLTSHLHSEGVNHVAGKKAFLLPAELVLDNNNTAYKSDTEALGVSNYVTTDGLPQDSQFGDTCADPENFRLQAILPDSTTNSIQMKLEVIRGGSTVTTHNYTLDKKQGDFVRGRFLRLVSDASDNAASGAGATSDTNNQTILVKLGDKVKASYDIVAGCTVEQEVQVARPSSENNNDVSPRKHDIRKLKLRLVVFKDGAGNPCVTDPQIDQDIEDTNERLAQSGIVIERANGSTATQLARPASFADGYSSSGGYVTTGTADEIAIAPLKDNDANTIDVFYVQTLNTDGGRGSSYPVARNQSGDPKYNNMVVIAAGSAGGGDPMNLAHEIMHVLLNSPHRADPNTAVFKGGTSWNKDVGGTKRIGPYPDAATAGVGQADTTTIRQNAETLP